MTEEWRPVLGLYEVSNLGRVRRGTRVRKGMTRNRTGHLTIDLWVDGVRVQRPVHQLVLEAFVGPPEPGQVCRHLNGVSSDNRLSNLTWGTHSENRLDSVGHGTHPQAKKDACPKGHAYDEENTRMYRGRRYCRRCDGWTG